MRCSLPAAREKAETTHYSVVDGEGNAVAVTYTINGSFGAAVIAPGTGFFLNNEMDDFTVKPGMPNLYGLVNNVGVFSPAAAGVDMSDEVWRPDHRHVTYVGLLLFAVVRARR